MLTVDIQINYSGWLADQMGHFEPRRVEELGRLAGPAVGCCAPSPCGRWRQAMGHFSLLGRMVSHHSSSFPFKFSHFRSIFVLFFMFVCCFFIYVNIFV
jgi:hypothetical protein